MVAARDGVTKVNRLLGSMNVYSKFDVNLVNLSGILVINILYFGHKQTIKR